MGDAHGHDDGHHDDHGHDDPLTIQFFTKPRQRQKWGDAQSLPHTNWGDTFFDLFYVAAAYNLGNLIREEPSRRGILYFSGCFFPIMFLWNQKMYYDSRFDVKDDVWHRLYQIGVVVSLATAVLHIRPPSILSNSKENVDMFIFCLSLAIGNLLISGRYMEILCGVVGQPVAKVAARRDMILSLSGNVFFIVASILAGMEHYSYQEDYKKYGSDPYDDSYNDYDKTTNTTSSYNSTYDDSDHRILAGGDDSYADKGSEYEFDIPIWLCLAGAIYFSFLLVLLLTLFFPGGGRHKEITVPMNITFAIHRYGEYIMLMLGETVLSLLIVDVTETYEYYKAFISGIISITLLEYLHFRSQPHDPDEHAMRRSKEAGIVFSNIMQIYSAALILLGTSYKMILYEQFYEEEYYSSGGSGRRMLFPFISRFLAGGGDPSGLDIGDRQQRIAHLFCGSMALVWLCSDVMIIVHKGFTSNCDRCRCEQTGSIKIIALLFALLRVGLIAFMATLSLYVTEPEKLAFIGLLGILSQIGLRYAGSTLFKSDVDDISKIVDPSEEFSSRKWPNVTEARSEPFEVNK